MYCSDFLSNMQYFWNKADQDFRKLSMVSRISEKRFLKQSEIRLQKSDMFLKTSDIPSGKLLHKLHNELERSTIFSWENPLFRLGHGFKLSYFFVAKSKDLQILATKIHQECRRTGSFAPRMHGLPLDFHWLWIVFNSRNAWYSASISWFWTWRSLNFHDFESFSQHFTCFSGKKQKFVL